MDFNRIDSKLTLQAYLVSGLLVFISFICTSVLPRYGFRPKSVQSRPESGNATLNHSPLYDYDFAYSSDMPLPAVVRGTCKKNGKKVLVCVSVNNLINLYRDLESFGAAPKVTAQYSYDLKFYCIFEGAFGQTIEEYCKQGLSLAKKKQLSGLLAQRIYSCREIKSFRNQGEFILSNFIFDETNEDIKLVSFTSPFFEGIFSMMNKSVAAQEVISMNSFGLIMASIFLGDLDLMKQPLVMMLKEGDEKAFIDLLLSKLFSASSGVPKEVSIVVGLALTAQHHENMITMNDIAEYFLENHQTSFLSTQMDAILKVLNQGKIRLGFESFAFDTDDLIGSSLRLTRSGVPSSILIYSFNPVFKVPNAKLLTSWLGSQSSLRIFELPIPSEILPLSHPDLVMTQAMIDSAKIALYKPWFEAGIEIPSSAVAHIVSDLSGKLYFARLPNLTYNIKLKGEDSENQARLVNASLRRIMIDFFSQIGSYPALQLSFDPQLMEKYSISVPFTLKNSIPSAKNYIFAFEKLSSSIERLASFSIVFTGDCVRLENEAIVKGTNLYLINPSSMFACPLDGKEKADCIAESWANLCEAFSRVAIDFNVVPDEIVVVNNNGLHIPTPTCRLERK